MIKKGQLLFVLSLTFVVVAAWVGFSIYHAWVTTTITPDLQLIITPISPDFDSVVLERLKSRQNVNPLFEMSGSGISSPSAVPSPTSLPIPTSSSIPTPTAGLEGGGGVN